MTEQEREELIEAMALRMERRQHGLRFDVPSDSMRAYARAALDIAEPVIREQCAEIADREANTAPSFETSDFLDGIAFGARVIAAAIRKGWKDD